MNDTDARDRTGAVRSVERALALIEALNRRAASSVGDLHRDTGIPKPTVVRLLKTLIGAGYVMGEGRRGGYQVAARVQSLSSGFHGHTLVLEAGRAWALALTRRLKWPVAIALLDHDAMVVRFSTIPESPMSPLHSTINQRFSLVSRAIGRAYLAFCSPDERRLLTALAARSDDPEDVLARDPERLDAMLREVRMQGFAERDRSALPRNSSTIAVPIMRDQRVLATIGLTFFVGAVPRPVLVDEYASLLQEAARAIASNLPELEPGAGGV